jgi:hypothetical protein
MRFPFFLFYIVLGSFLFVILFFFLSFLFPSYSSFLILLFCSLLSLLVGTILRLLIILNCLLYYRHNISVILKDFSRGQAFFDPFGVKISVYDANIRPYFFLFHPFYCFLIFTSCYSIFILIFISLFLFFTSYI